MRVVVDYDLCESNALCMAAAPEVFEVRDDDFMYVLQEEPPEELREKVMEAVQRCPKQAIKLRDRFLSAEVERVAKVPALACLRPEQGPAPRLPVPLPFSRLLVCTGG